MRGKRSSGGQDFSIIMSKLFGMIYIHTHIYMYVYLCICL